MNFYLSPWTDFCHVTPKDRGNIKHVNVSVLNL